MSPGAVGRRPARPARDERGASPRVHVTVRRSLPALACSSAVAAAFAHAVWLGWGKWGELLFDTGRELEVPRRMLNGERLYADLRWYYGPLAPWVNSILYRCFGVRYEVLACGGIASAALMALALFLLARRFTDRLVSTAVVLAFVYLCAFGRSGDLAIFNFAVPYTYAATYGAVAGAWSLVFLVRHAQGGGRVEFLLSAGLLALTALAKLEAVAPVLAAHGVFLLAAALDRRLERSHLASWAGAAVLVAAVYGALALQVGSALWTRNLGGVVNEGSRQFILFSSGLDRPGTSLLQAAASAALLATSCGLAVGAGRLRRPWLRAAALGVVGAGGFLAYARLGVPLGFRCVPFVLAAVLILLAQAYVRTPPRRRELLPRALVFAFALGAAYRIPLRFTPDHYGFYLLPCALVCLAILIVDRMPTWVGGGAAARAALRPMAVALLLGAAVSSYVLSRANLDEQTVEVATPRGRLFLPESRGKARDAVEIASRFPRGARMLVLPAGVGISFFAGLEGCDSMFSYLPMELADPQTERALLAQWQLRPPDVVLFTPVDVTEFGVRGFGVDYGLELGAWLRERYQPANAGDFVFLVPARPHPAAAPNSRPTR